MLDWLWLIVGAGVLYLGAEWLVRGAAGLALSFGLSQLVVGLTVVAYGTSAPEVTVGIAAAIEQRGAIALGNSIGSNIANLGLILGMTALISPPRVEGGLIRRELPLLVLTTAALPLLLLDGAIGRIEGIVLALAAIAYTVWAVRSSRGAAVEATAGAREIAADAEQAGAPRGGGRTRLVIITVVGLALLVGGGKLFVDGAIGVARSAGISERIIGLTIVAVGTSLPELATSLVAALRGHSSLAVGNVVGSNIFNVLVILGVAGIVRPIEAKPAAIALDLGFLAGITLLALALLRTARTITRLEGALLVLSYVGFLFAVLLA